MRRTRDGGPNNDVGNKSSSARGGDGARADEPDADDDELEDDADEEAEEESETGAVVGAADAVTDA